MQIWCEHSSVTLRGEKGEMAAQQCRWDSLTCGAAWGREASFHRSVIWSECPSTPENYPIITQSENQVLGSLRAIPEKSEQVLELLR